MLKGTAKVFIGMGGNFVRAVPDTDLAYSAMRGLALTVGIATKLNRGHLVHGRDALILPVIARSERIETAAGEQFVTIEDSMSNVTASRGVLEPASEHLKSEVEIVCRIAMATLPDSRIPGNPISTTMASSVTGSPTSIPKSMPTSRRGFGTRRDSISTSRRGGSSGRPRTARRISCCCRVWKSTRGSTTPRC